MKTNKMSEKRIKIEKVLVILMPLIILMSIFLIPLVSAQGECGLICKIGNIFTGNVKTITGDVVYVPANTANFKCVKGGLYCTGSGATNVILRIDQNPGNSHAGIADTGVYPGGVSYNTICCNGLTSSTVSGQDIALKLDSQYNAHAKQKTSSYAVPIYVSSSGGGTASCHYVAGNCPTNEVCLVKMSNDAGEGAHVAACAESTTFTNSICCLINCIDADNDNYSPEGGNCGPVDCNDASPEIINAADGTCDGDGDGFIDSSAGGNDCNDAIGTVNPGASDNNCNGIDDNCNVKIDEQSTAAPVTTASAGAYVFGTWTNQNVTVDLTATKGCVNININQTKWCKSLSPGCTDFIAGNSFNIIDEGNWTVRFYSTDMNGNSEAVNSKNVLIDQTPPLPGFPFRINELPQWNNNGIVILSWQGYFVDSLSGFNHYEVWRASKPLGGIQSIFTKVSGNLQNAGFTDTGLSTDTTYYYNVSAADNANNVRWTDNIVSTTVVTTKPSVQITSPTSSQIFNANTTILKANYKGNYTINCTANLDNNPPVRMLGDNKVSGTANYTFINIADGLHNFTVTCADQAGNSANTIINDIRIDTIAPATASSFTSTDWQTSDISISLSCTDSGSGCDKIYYYIDTTNSSIPSLTYSTTLVHNIEGIRYIRYRSVDKAGNTGTTISQILNLDKTKPVTTASISGTTYSDGYYGNASVTLARTDATPGSGIKETKYCIGLQSICTPLSIYSAPFVVSNFGINNVSYYSTDNANNNGAVITSKIIIHGCGDNVIDSLAPANEQCDGSNLGGANCSNLKGPYGGVLGCTACSYDFSGCVPLDSDNDGRVDFEDNCINTPNPGQEDSDGDGIGNACDNCWDVANLTQTDTDNDCSNFRLTPTSPYNSDPQCGDACCRDADNDKYQGISATCTRGTDCNDANKNINPGILEASFYNADNITVNYSLCLDGIDNNCNNKCDIGSGAYQCGTMPGESGCQVGIPSECSVPEADADGILNARDFYLFALVNSSTANKKLYQPADVAGCKNLIIENTTAI
jgi:hypothetical protein